MRKIVSLANNTSEPSYETAVFSQLSDVEYIKATAKGDAAVIEALKDAEVVLFTGTDLNRHVIENLEKCRLMVRYGIGYDTVDLEAAKQKGIYVCNSPKYGVIDVAEHALALLFAAARRIAEMHGQMRSNSWCESACGVRLAGKTIGFVGFGSIGQAVCQRTNACQMRPLVYDPYVSDEVLSSLGAQRVSLDALLENADFITCHAPLNADTYHMLGAAQFRKMKNTAILVNTSRGGIIDEAALVDALLNKELAGVGLDVFEKEGCNQIDPRLLQAPNAVLTPHSAWNTPDAADSLHREVVDNVVRYLRGERPQSIVNGL